MTLTYNLYIYIKKQALNAPLWRLKNNKFPRITGTAKMIIHAGETGEQSQCSLVSQFYSCTNSLEQELVIRIYLTWGLKVCFFSLSCFWLDGLDNFILLAVGGWWLVQNFSLCFGLCAENGCSCMLCYMSIWRWYWQRLETWSQTHSMVTTA